MSRLASAFRYLDILAPDITLNVRGKSSIKTLPGAVLSICYTALVIYFVVLQLSQYLDTSSPQVMQEKSRTGNYIDIDLIKNKHIPMVNIVQGTGTSNTHVTTFEESQSYATIRLDLLHYKLAASLTDFDVTVTPLPAVDCAKLMEEGNLDKDLLSGFFLEGNSKMVSGICFNTSGIEAVLKGSNTQVPATFAQLSILPCSLPDPTKCQPLSQLATAYVSVIYIEPEVNYANRDKPIGYLTNPDVYLPVNPVMHNDMKQKLVNNEIVDDNGFLFPTTSVINYTATDKLESYSKYRDASQITCTFLEIVNQKCRPYISIFTISTNNKVTTRRIYKGLLETLGEIGGLRDLVTPVFILLYIFYHQSASKSEIVKAAFKLEQKPNKKNCGCIKKKVVGPSQSQIMEVKGDAIQVPAEVIDLAYKQIESSLDIVEIAKEAASLRYLITALLDSESRVALPTVFCMSQARKEIAKKVSNTKGSDPSPQLSETIEKIKTINPTYSSPFGNELAEETVAMSPSESPAGGTNQSLARGSILNHQLKHLIRHLTLGLLSSTSPLRNSTPLTIMNSPVQLQDQSPRVPEGSYSKLKKIKVGGGTGQIMKIQPSSDAK